MRRIFTFALLGFVLLLSACASKPEQELADAQKALEAARTAEADVYSADAYQASAEALKSAEAEIAAQEQNSAMSRNFDKAKELLAQAKTQADSAASTAAANKDRVKGEAETAQTEAQAAIDAVKTALSKAPKGKGTKADLEALTADLTAAEGSLMEAQTALAGGKYMDALNQFRAVKEKADAVAADIAQATQKKKAS